MGEGASEECAVAVSPTLSVQDGIRVDVYALETRVTIGHRVHECHSNALENDDGTYGRQESPDAD